MCGGGGGVRSDGGKGGGPDPPDPPPGSATGLLPFPERIFIVTGNLIGYI